MTTNTIQNLKALTDGQPSATLLAAHASMEEKGWANLDDAERLTAATIADVLTERHEIEDAIDALLFDEAFEGTYHDALLIAMAVKGVTL